MNNFYNKIEALKPSQNDADTLCKMISVLYSYSSEVKLTFSVML